MTEADIDINTEMLQKPEIKEIPFNDVKVEISEADFAEWDALIDPQIASYRREHSNPQDKLALMVGRFQPPHKGHAYQMYAALKTVLATDGKLAIVVGSPKENPKEEDKRHPLPFEERVDLLLTIAQQLEKRLGTEDIEKKIGFVHMRDVGNDKLWGEKVTEVVEGSFEQPIDVVFANDGRKPGTEEHSGAVQGIFENLGKRVLPLEPFKRYEYEGTELRKKIPFGPSGKNIIVGKPHR